MRSRTLGTYVLSLVLAGAGIAGGTVAASGASVPADTSRSSGVLAGVDTTGALGVMSATKMPRSRSRIFHVPKGVSHMVENSPLGIRLASAGGYHWIDLDANISADGVLVIAHWARIRKDKFVLPSWFISKYGKQARIAQVPWADLAKLHTRPLRFRGHREVARYHTASYMMRLLGRTRQLGMALEVKADWRFKYPVTFRSLVAHRRSVGLSETRLMVMTLQNMGDPWARLRAVKAAGIFPAVLLARGPIPQSRRNDFDYVRGPMRWVG